MTTSDTQTTVTEAQTETPADSCPVCSHPRDAHDAISTRFCTATAAGKYDRGCVCTARS